MTRTPGQQPSSPSTPALSPSQTQHPPTLDDTPPTPIYAAGGEHACLLSTGSTIPPYSSTPNSGSDVSGSQYSHTSGQLSHDEFEDESAPTSPTPPSIDPHQRHPPLQAHPEVQTTTSVPQSPHSTRPPMSRQDPPTPSLGAGGSAESVEVWVVVELKQLLADTRGMLAAERAEVARLRGWLEDEGRERERDAGLLQDAQARVQQLQAALDSERMEVGGGAMGAGGCCMACCMSPAPLYLIATVGKSTAANRKYCNTNQGLVCMSCHQHHYPLLWGCCCVCRFWNCVGVWRRISRPCSPWTLSCRRLTRKW